MRWMSAAANGKCYMLLVIIDNNGQRRAEKTPASYTRIWTEVASSQVARSSNLSAAPYFTSNQHHFCLRVSACFSMSERLRPAPARARARTQMMKEWDCQWERKFELIWQLQIWAGRTRTRGGDHFKPRVHAGGLLTNTPSARHSRHFTSPSPSSTLVHSHTLIWRAEQL